MGKFLFENNARSSLASGVGTSDTTWALASGEGAKFPSPSGGDYFYISAVKTDNTVEVAKCTARSGDNLTVTRAQDGTTALSFISGDVVFQGITQGIMEDLMQKPDTTTKDNIPSFDADGNAQDSGHKDYFISFRADAAGTVDAITPTPVPDVPALTDGIVCVIKAAGANATTTPTFAPSGLTAKTIVKENGLPMEANDIGGAAHRIQLVFDSTLDKWVLMNPAGVTNTDIEHYMVKPIHMANLREGVLFNSYGDENKGAHVFTASESWIGNTLKDFSSLTLGSSYTLDLASGNVIIIRCSGRVTLAGTIDLDYIAAGNGLVSGGGGGGGAQSSQAGVAGGGLYAIPGGDAGTHTGDGSDGTGFSAADDDMYAQLTAILNGLYLLDNVSGSAGGDGATNFNGSYTYGAGGAKGLGGGGLIIIAKEIDFSGTINARGASGSNGSGSGSQQGGGGGGGSGGFVLLAAETFIADTGTVTVTGSPGGTSGIGGGDGGDGGVGINMRITIAE